MLRCWLHTNNYNFFLLSNEKGKVVLPPKFHFLLLLHIVGLNVSLYHLFKTWQFSRRWWCWRNIGMNTVQWMNMTKSCRLPNFNFFFTRFSSHLCCLSCFDLIKTSVYMLSSWYRDRHFSPAKWLKWNKHRKEKLLLCPLFFFSCVFRLQLIQKIYSVLCNTV